MHTCTLAIGLKCTLCCFCFIDDNDVDISTFDRQTPISIPCTIQTVTTCYALHRRDVVCDFVITTSCTRPSMRWHLCCCYYLITLLQSHDCVVVDYILSLLNISWRFYDYNATYFGYETPAETYNDFLNIRLYLFCLWLLWAVINSLPSNVISWFIPK